MHSNDDRHDCRGIHSHFEMLTRRTSFNKAALEDAYIWDSLKIHPFEVYSQTSLPSGMDNWKAVVCNLDRSKEGMLNWNSQFVQAEHHSPRWTPQLTTQSTGYLNALWTRQKQVQTRNHSCYNCNEKVISHQHCQNSRSTGFGQSNLTETDLKSLVANSSSGSNWMHERSRRRQRNLRRVFRLVNSEIHALSDQQVLVLEHVQSGLPMIC